MRERPRSASSSITAASRNCRLNTRNVYSLIYLTPGVSGTIGNAYGDLRYTINGARPRSSDTLIDGVTATFPTVTGGSGISVFPSVDAIQEFKVLGATFPAEFGRSLGSVVNVAYKSGTQQLPRQRLRVPAGFRVRLKNYFQKLRGETPGDFSRHQFGGSAGGPIQLGKMFYMVSFEGLRENAFASSTLTVPTARERQGDFSQTFAANGQLVRIFNPFTTRANPAGSGFIRDQFADNRIPANLIDPVALNIIKYYPQPNQPGDRDHRTQQLLHDRNVEPGHGEHRHPRRPEFRRDGARLRALLASLRADRAAAGVPRRADHRRRARHRGEPHP